MATIILMFTFKDYTCSHCTVFELQWTVLAMLIILHILEFLRKNNTARHNILCLVDRSSRQSSILGQVYSICTVKYVFY